MRLLSRRANARDARRRCCRSGRGAGDSNLLLDRQTTTAKDCNQVAQKLDKAILKLGGTRFYAYGEADDRTGNEEVAPWISGLGAAVKKQRSILADDDDDDDGTRERLRNEAKAERSAAEAAERAEKERIEALAAKWL